MKKITEALGLCEWHWKLSFTYLREIVLTHTQMQGVPTNMENVLCWELDKTDEVE